MAFRRRLSHMFFTSVSRIAQIDKKHSDTQLEAENPIAEEAVTPDGTTMFSGSYDALSNILGERVIRSLKSCGFVNTTIIQKAAIPKIVEGNDVLIRSATGSGKTLTFLVPALNRLVHRGDERKINRQDGTIVMIVCPTRELSDQTKDMASKLSRPFPWIVVAAIKGGDSRKSEKAQIRKGITLLVGTPGRVLDHCEKTSSFNVSNIEMFVLDEADRLLDMGFETKIRGICKFLSASRSGDGGEGMQTVMTSATLTEAVRKLANFCLRKNPCTIGIDDDILSLPSTLTHEYVLVECKDKFICLVSLLLKYVDNREKVIIFVSNCQSVTYFHNMLRSLTWPTIEGFKRSRDDNRDKMAKKMEKYSTIVENYELKVGKSMGQFKGVQIDGQHRIPIFSKVPIFMLHGNMETNDRTGYINDFMNSRSAILISTDVASRGLNLSEVNRVIQYDAPQQLEEYIHRSGRTARLGGKGNATMILMQHEVHFIETLRKRGISVKQVLEGLVWSYIENTYVPKHLSKFKGYNVAFLRNCFSDFVANDSDLLSAAQGAFRSSVQSYKTYSKDLRRIFDFKKLHLGHYAASFCLKQKPSDIMHASYQTNNEKVNKGVSQRLDYSKSHVKRTRPVSKPSRQQRVPKAAALGKDVSQAALMALEVLKAKNQVLPR